MKIRFAGHLLDCDQYELRRGDDRVDVQPKVLSLLRLLAENGHRTVPKDEILDALWPDVVVAEGSLQRLASLARSALSDPEGEVLRTVRGVGYQLAAPVEVEARPAPAVPVAEARTRQEQQIRYCRTVEGVNLAWSSVGEGPPLVRSLGWFTNLEREWSWDAGRRFWEKLAHGRRLIRYDGRGMGLSDSADEFSLETRLRDLEAVVDAAGLERFDLLGMSEGCAAATVFAARQPARVRRLVLYGAAPTLFMKMGDQHKADGRAMRAMMQASWGGGSPAYARMLAALFVGEAASEETKSYFDRMQRASADRETAIRYFKSLAGCDVRSLASSLRVPTLVAHRRDDLICPFDAGRAAAALIPGARFVPLTGDNHWPLVDDAGADAFIEVLRAFLAEE